MNAIQNIQSQNSQSGSSKAMLDLDIDSLEIESFVTGLNDYEKDAINKGYDLSCTMDPSTDTGVNCRINCA